MTALWPLLFFFLPYSRPFKTCTQPPCPCFPMEGRPEVRQLSAEQRTNISAAFRKARGLVPKKAWTQPGKTICLLVNSLDASLYPNRFPFWDSRIEERMRNPKDSFIFLGKFFLDKSMRRRRRSRGQHARDLRIPSAMSPLIFSALRSGRHAQMLLFMHSVGLQMRRFINDTCDNLCPGKPQFLTCSNNKCLSKLRSGAVCSENSLPDYCYDSICINNICSVPSVKQHPPEVETYKVIRDEGLMIVQLADGAPKSKDEADVEGSGVKPRMAHHQNYYEVQTMNSTSKHEISTNHHDKRILDFNDTLPFPTVYIPVSIMKKRSIHHFLDDIEYFKIYTQGANFPSGYTQQLAGLMTTSGRAYVRVLDPSQTLVVEAHIHVKYNGKACLPTCLIKKGSYKECDDKLRLSRYEKLSDAIRWYKQAEDIPTSWTGSGYYRKPSNDYFLFKCA